MIIQNELVTILRDAIEENKKKLEEYNKFQDQNIEEKEKLEKALILDINNIINADFELIKSIVESFAISIEEKEMLIEELKIITKLLTLNYGKGTSIKLNVSQKKILKNFLDNLKDYIRIRKQYHSKPTLDLENIEKLNKKYKRLANALDKQKSMTLITELDLLTDLFDKKGKSEEDKTHLYEFILKYNQRIYNYKMGNCNVKELTTAGKIDINKLKQIFKENNYDFEKLPIFIQESIVNKANFSNIKSVFKALDRNGYVLDINKNSYLLMSLLISSDKTTIDKISGLAFSKGLTPPQVLTIGSILIKQSEYQVKNTLSYERFNIVGIENSGPIIAGSSINFEKNTKVLAKWGLSVKYVYDRCKYLLLCSHETLNHNLNLFQEYGFSLKRKINKLCSATLSSLMQENSFEIIDRFIEVHPLGLEYLRNNLSILRQIKSKDDILFYKLYYSNKNCGSKEAFIKIINNKSSVLCLQGEVSGLTPLYQIPYANINEQNKRAITKTFIPTYSIDYYSVIKDKIDLEIEASIFDNPYIQYVNKYSDHKEPLLYNFNGIRISKMKVLRIFDAVINSGIPSSEEAFLFSLLYNTIISKDDYLKLQKIIRIEGRV